VRSDPNAAAARENGPGQTVWLASFPKSGNTWMRAIVTALQTGDHLFAVNQLGSGAQPFHVGGAVGRWGMDVRWVDNDEIEVLRSAMTHRRVAPPSDAPPMLRKTHELYRPGSDGREPFPLAATRAAILIVRDPRDVACSYAPFFGTNLAGAVASMQIDRPAYPNPAQQSARQPWGSWSSHTLSWLDETVPFPVHLVRYEDMRSDAVGVLKPVFDAIGMPVPTEDLAAAVERTRFDRLKSDETDKGFRETSPKTRTFFRKGRAGGWREELPENLVARLRDDHGPVMEMLGYHGTEPTPSDDDAVSVVTPVPQ